MQIHKSQRNGSCALGGGRAWLWSALNSARSDQIIRCGLCTDVRCWSRFLGPECLLSPLGRQPPRATGAPGDFSMGTPPRERRGALRARGGLITEELRAGASKNANKRLLRSSHHLSRHQGSFSLPGAPNNQVNIQFQKKKRKKTQDITPHRERCHFTSAVNLPACPAQNVNLMLIEHRSDQARLPLPCTQSAETA